jgi:hypothetical protein
MVNALIVARIMWESSGTAALAVFERKILQKIYKPVKENELWRIL